MQWTITLNQSTNEQLNRMAVLTQCGEQELLENIVANSISERLERLAAIQEGLDDIQAGRTIPHDVVMKEMEELIENIGLQA